MNLLLVHKNLHLNKGEI